MGPDAARAGNQPPNAVKDDEREDNGQITEGVAAERQLIDKEIEESKKVDQAGPEMRVAEVQAQFTALERAVAKINEDLSRHEQEVKLVVTELWSDKLLMMYVLQGSKNGKIVNLNLSSVGRVSSEELLTEF